MMPPAQPKTAHGTNGVLEWVTTGAGATTAEKAAVGAATASEAATAAAINLFVFILYLSSKGPAV